METTFMTIHNLTPNANILFASESIVEILGYQPHEVQGKSCFDYFHPDEVPFAKDVHSRGVQLDKAAVLHYARIQNRNGEWIGCECVFTIVHDVLVACTSIYKRDGKSEQRAMDAPAVQRLFASSPRDPRYHMLEHLSTKFRQAPQPSIREPRAALILNRFTRTLTVMFATNAVTNILGITPETLRGKSFYECIKENCLQDAIRCLESAKANDSIAYLRFWYRDPRRPEELDHNEREASHSSDDDDGGVILEDHMDLDSNGGGPAAVIGRDNSRTGRPALEENSRTSSTGSSDLGHNASNSIFDNDRRPGSKSGSASQVHSAVNSDGRRSSSRRTESPDDSIEIEAVVSCTSDGLVVILRRARPMEPSPQQPAISHANGLFAAPWGVDPIRPHVPDVQFAFQPSHMQELQAVRAHSRVTGGPSMDSFMNSIREVAVFAWSLTGINGNIAKYGRGTPMGESVPATGFPVWDPNAQTVLANPPENQAYRKWAELNQRAAYERSNEPQNQVQLPYVHHRQEQLMRQQYGYGSGPMGSDVPGSSARQYLGKYIGDDGKGPNYFPRMPDPYQGSADHDTNMSYGFNEQGQETIPHQNRESAANAPGPVSKEQEEAGDSVFHGNRYLWY